MKKRSIACMCPSGSSYVIENPQEVNPDAVQRFFESKKNAVFIMSKETYEKLGAAHFLESTFEKLQKIVITEKTVLFLDDDDETTTFPSLWGALDFAEGLKKTEVIFIGEQQFLQTVVGNITIKEVHRFFITGKPGPEVKISENPLTFKENKENWEDTKIKYIPGNTDNYNGGVQISTHCQK